MGLRDLAYPGMANYPYTDVAPMDRYLAEGRKQLAGLTPREIEGRFGGPSFRSNEVNPFSAMISDTLRKTGPVGNFMTEWTQDALDTHARGDYLPWQKIALAATEGPLGTASKGLPLVAGTFGSVLAKNAPKGLDEALKAGKKIKGNPWWVESPDLMPRFEIDDGLAVWNHEAIQRLPAETDRLGNITRGMRLRDVVDHPKLLDNYPDMDKIQVYRTTDPDSKGSFLGRFDSQGNLTGGTLKVGIVNRKKHEIEGTILHELQHWIQNFEGLSPGSSKVIFDQIISLKPRLQREATKAENTLSVVRLMKKEGLTRNQAKEKLGLKASEYDFGDASDFSSGKLTLQDLLIKSRDAQQNWDTVKGLEKTDSGYNYFRTLGEMEARDVATRYAQRKYFSFDEISENLPPSIMRESTELDRVNYPGEVISPKTDALVLAPDRGKGINLGGIVNAQKGGSQSNIELHHASQHLFDKFDLSYFGTGEGASMVAHGIYLAEAPRVSGPTGHYTKIFQSILDNKKGTLQNRISSYKSRLNQPRGISNVEAMQLRNKIADMERELRNTDFTATSYKVHVPDEAVAKMLHRDLPLDQQPRNVQEFAKNIWRKIFDEPYDPKMNAQDFYDYLADHYHGQEGASALLKRNGIPGVKYYDGDSRQITYGTHNYVIFDDNIIKILHRTRGGKVEDFTKKFKDIETAQGDIVSAQKDGSTANSEPVDFSKFKDKKEMDLYYKELKEAINTKGKQISDRTKKFFMDNPEEPFYPINSRYITPSGNKVTIIGSPSIIMKAKQPSYRVKIEMKDGSDYESSMLQENFKQFRKFTGPTH